MDVELMVMLAAAILATAGVMWLIAKGWLVGLMNKLGEINDAIAEKMDVLPPAAQDVAKEIMALIEEIRLSVADGKVSFNEIIAMAQHVKAMWKELKELADGML